MIKYDRITPEGTRDYLFEECEAHNEIKQRLRNIFEENGYREVMTPGFEFYDVFSKSAMYYPQESMYKFTDNRGRLLTMRPDSTIPIARMTATKLKGHDLPIRIYYAQKVYRLQPELKGKRSEIMQMGVELIGTSTYESDVEILKAALSALDACSSSSYRIELGHVGIFKLLMDRVQAEKEVKDRIHGHIAAKNYAALGDMLEGFQQDKTIEILRELPKLFGGEEAFERAQSLFNGYDEQLTQMLDYLKRIYQAMSGQDRNARIVVDFGLVNEAEYYSSLVFKGYTVLSGEPVLSGGRYDKLFSDFGEDLPATGFAMNVDRLADGLLVSGWTAGGGRPEAKADEEEDSRLRVALTKGRLEKSVVEMLAKAGYDVDALIDKGRKLLIEIPGKNIEVVLAKAADVITYVEHGVCDIGIVGKDTIAEQGGTFYEILDLGIGVCKFALAVPKGRNFYSGYGSKRIATKYPQVAGDYFENKGMDIQIIKIEGSVELAPLLDLADGIVDIVETGTTLKENGLEVIEDIRRISARMIVNVASMKLKKNAIDEFAEALAGTRAQ